MDFSTILMAVYILIALFAAGMTYAEQRQSQTMTRLFAPLAYLMCALWPLAVMAMLISMQFDRLTLTKRQPSL